MQMPVPGLAGPSASSPVQRLDAPGLAGPDDANEIEPSMRGVFVVRDPIGFRLVEVMVTPEELQAIEVSRTEPDVLPIILGKADAALEESLRR